jgi:hypothetical protein
MVMLSLRAHAWICAGLLAALFAIPIAGNVWAGSGGQLPKALQRPFMIGYFALFLAFGLSAIPVMVKAVLRGQEKLGNANEPLVAGAIRHQAAIVWAMWLLILGGLAIALPEMVRDGFFTPQTP